MGMKNMAIMFAASSFMRRVDHEEPQLLRYARLAYLAYIVFTTTVYLLLHLRIMSRRDTSLITVPAPPKAPSMSEALAAARARVGAAVADGDEAEETQPTPAEQAPKKAAAEKNGKKKKKRPANQEDTSPPDKDADAADAADATPDAAAPPKDEVMTVFEYDLRLLSTARKGWVRSACILSLVHYYMQSPSPLLMTALMGLTRLLADDPLVAIHLRGAPAVGAFARPFAPDQGMQLGNLLKELGDGPKTEGNAEGAAPTSPDDDLHDDGDDSDLDTGPLRTIDDLPDDDGDGDFDDEEEERKKTE